MARQTRTKPIVVDLTAQVGDAHTIVLFGVSYERGFFEALRDAQEPGETIAVDVDADGARRIVVRKAGVTRPARAPRGTPGSEFFTAEEWFRLPPALRERWWAETDYSKRTPSPDLLRAIYEERK